MSKFAKHAKHKVVSGTFDEREGHAQKASDGMAPHYRQLVYEAFHSAPVGKYVTVYKNKENYIQITVTDK